MNDNTLKITQQEIRLDFCQHTYNIVLAKQYDKKSRFVPILCTDQGQPFPLNPEYVVHVKLCTPDKRAILNTVPIQPDGSLLLELTETMLSYPGKAEAEIRIYTKDAKKLLTTMSFFVMIEPSVYGEDQTIASDEFNALLELMEKALADYTYVITQARESAEAAKLSETNAKNSEDAAESYKISAEISASEAENSASEAEAFATKAESFACGGTGTRAGEDTDNAKYYHDQVKAISDDLGKVLLPKGTVVFTDLPALSASKTGDMYNVSDQFTTTDDFREGAGHVIAAGSNVYKTTDGKWDVLAGTPVAGVKGSTETEYHTGLVTVSAQNVGALPLTGGTMQGDITLPDDQSIIQEAQSASNYTTALTWYKGGVKPNTKYAPHIGYHSTGGNGTGAIAVVPQNTDTDPWTQAVGLFLNDSKLKFNGKNVITEAGGPLSGLLSPNAGTAYAGYGDANGTYIAYPSDGSMNSKSSAVTGHITITLPTSWTSSMLKFSVSIYNYATGTSVDYIVSGYNYSVGSAWHNCTAVCIGKYGATHSNLTVRFGHNGTKCVVLIGETNTVWQYPHVKVHDILVSYENHDYATWKSGWHISVDQTNPTITQTIASTHVANGVMAENAKLLSGWTDARNAATTPNDYNSALKPVGIKTPAASGALDGSTYSTLVGIRGWTDNSGGKAHELAFTGNGKLYHRAGSTTSWEAWKEIAHTDSSITGNAATATNADKLDGYHGSAAQAVNTYVLRQSSGYVYLNYINSNTSNNENPAISQVIVTNGTDHFYRKASLAHLKAQMGLNNVNNTADANKTVYNSNYLNFLHGNEINFRSGTSVTGVWFNYRNGDNDSSSGNTAITSYSFGNKNGGTSGVTLNAAAFSGNAATATTAAKLGRSGNSAVPMTFHWSGQSGQPTWLWGGSDGTNMYVYNPSNFSVKYATSAGSASSATNATQSYGVVATNSENARVAMSGGGNFRTYNRAGSAALDGAINLGSGSQRWKQVYATTTTISTSDRNLKDNIHPLTQKHLEFFTLLQPVSFTLKGGDSGRTHMGFISQDVESAMEQCGLTSLDFAGFCRDIKTMVYFEEDEEGNKIEIEKPDLDEDGNLQYIYSLRYEEFIALNTHMIQKLCDRVSALTCEGNELRSRVEALEQLVLQKS